MTNLGLVTAAQNQFEEAIALLTESKSILEDMQDCGCLKLFGDHLYEPQ